MSSMSVWYLFIFVLIRSCSYYYYYYYLVAVIVVLVFNSIYHIEMQSNFRNLLSVRDYNMTNSNMQKMLPTEILRQ